MTEPEMTEPEAETDQDMTSRPVTEHSASLSTELTNADGPAPATEAEPEPENIETPAAKSGDSEVPKAAPAPPKPSAIPTPAAIAATAKPRPSGTPAMPSVDTEPSGTDPQASPMNPADVAAASEFGRVSDDGTVSVVESSGERVVGQFPDVSKEEALSLYIRRYLDLKAQVELFAARLPQLTMKDLDGTQTSLTAALEEPAAVGNLDALRARFAELKEAATDRRRQINAEREEARAKALAERTALVEQAELIAAMDPARVQWKAQGQTLRDLLDSWKAAQKSGPRLDRPSEDALWKRFAIARSTFDKHRRQFFSDLDKSHTEAKQVKEKLIERAVALQTSTDWGPTTLAYRDLMVEWKSAGRAAHKDDDALWARFRGAQDVFFEARTAANAQIDAEYGENLKVKMAILAEAEALVPVQDLKQAKGALRDFQDRWEAAGKVPREDVQRIESRMRAVEQAIRDADQHEWRAKNPRVRARAEGAAAQLQDAIAALEQDVEKAKASGDKRAIESATEALDARKAWLEQVLRAADDAG